MKLNKNTWIFFTLVEWVDGFSLKCVLVIWNYQLRECTKYNG